MATPGSGIEAPVEKKSSLPRIGAIAALLILAAITSWWALTQRGGEQLPVEVASILDPNRIAVVPFTNRTGDASFDNLAALTADRLTQGLADLDEIEVAPASVVSAASAGVDQAILVREVAKGTDSGLVLTGVWDAVGTGLELQATLEDAQAGTVIYAFDPIPTNRDAPQEAIATLRDWTLMAVQDHLHPILAWGAGDRFPEYEAYQAYRRFFEAMKSSTEEGAKQLFQARQLDPEFVRPLIHAGAAWTPGVVSDLHDMGIGFFRPVHEMTLTARQQLLVEMIDARMDGRWGDAHRLSKMELERDPSNSWARKDAIRNASFTNRPYEAIELYSHKELDPLTPGVYIYGTVGHVLRAYHLTGQHEEELALARQYVAEGTGITHGRSIRSQELRALAALGRIEEIDSMLTEVFLEPDIIRSDSAEMLAVVQELRAHGFLAEAQALAERAVAWFESNAVLSTATRCDPCQVWTLMAAGNNEKARGILEGLVAENPDSRGWVWGLGLCAARLGDRETVLEMDTRLVELGDNIGPTGVPYGARGSTEFNRAGIAAQLGDRDHAIHLLQQAVAAGFSYYIDIHADPYLKPLWDDPEFQEILRPKG